MPDSRTVTLTGVNDEPTKEWSLEPALDALDAIGTKFVELRAVDGKNVDDMTDDQFTRAWELIQARGFTITGYDSNLGKCELLPENLEKEAERMEKAAERTAETDTPFIRTMGYRRGPCSVKQWRERTLEWLQLLTDMATDADRTLILENCMDRPSSMGCAPNDCLDIMQSINSPNLRMNLDPGNFANWGQDAMEGAEILGVYTANVHVKDLKEPGDRSTFCLAGDGVAKIPEIFAHLRSLGFDGNITIEPHLRMHESYHYSGWDDYVAAGKRIHELLLEAGFEVRTSI